MSRDLAQLLEDAAIRPDAPDDLPDLVARGRRRGTVRRVVVVAGVPAVAVTAAVAVAATVLPPIATPEVTDQPTEATDPAPATAEPTPTPGSDTEPGTTLPDRIGWLPELDTQRSDLEERLGNTPDPEEQRRLQIILDQFNALTQQGPEDALAPVDAIDWSYRSLVMSELTHRADAVVHSCLQNQGLTPSGPYVERGPRDIVGAMISHRVQYPNLDLIEAVGLPIEPSPSSESSAPDGGPPETPSPDAAYLQAVGQCKESPEYQSAFDVRERVYALGELWGDQGEDRNPDPGERERFYDCLVAAGVPAESARTPVDFLGYAGREQLAAIDESGVEAGEAVGQDHGRLYAECAGPLFQDRVAARERLRPDFLNAHQAELDELAAIIESLDDRPLPFSKEG